MNSDQKSLVCLYSDSNFLAVNILENLLANNCFVNIVCQDFERWILKTSHIAAKNKFSILGFDSLSKNINYNYVIFCAGFLDKENVEKSFRKFISSVDINNKKVFIVLPKEISKTFNIKLLNLPNNVGIIYLGDVLGPRIDLNSNLKIAEYLNEIIGKRRLSIPVGEVFYPVFVSDVARQIVKWLFAFGPFGKETYLLGPDTSSDVFWQINSKLVGEINHKIIADDDVDSVPRDAESFRFSKDLTFCLTETYKWISSNPEKIIKVKPRKPDVNFDKINLGKFRFLLLPLLIIFLLPIILLMIGGGLSYISYLEFRAGRNNLAKNLLYANKYSSFVSYYESRALKYIPIVGYIYKETEYVSNVSLNLSNIGIEAMPLVKTGADLFSNVMNKSPYSPGSLLADSSTHLQNIYLALSNIEEATVKTKDSLAARYVLSKVNFENYKQLVSQVSLITERLPEVLGKDKSKTYLVLFENNMELRPTGGFIGSYGLLTFDSGRLSDFVISDVYSADGQLNGHVEPPTPIRLYLGEANWWLRDSNWDPDFPTSAKRARWFLDKEIDKQVDGVISVDLNPVKNFLKVSGKISLPDYSLEINENNLYEKVQSEVQDNFFAGTHKKASFLTALSRSILEKTGDLSSQQKTSVLKLIYDGLSQRHIQVLVDNDEFQKAVASLGWDGSVFTPVCEGDCYSDLTGIVEANLGSNKSNYFIKRSVDMNIMVGKSEIQRSLTLSLQNSANSNLGLSGKYKVYIRLLVPEDSVDIKVVGGYGQNSTTLTPDITGSKGRKEVGVIFEVLAGESKQLSFSWSKKLDSTLGRYQMYYRKQAGVEAYPFSLKINSAAKILGTSPVFTLTDQGSYLYNTTLVRDLFAKLSY